MALVFRSRPKSSTNESVSVKVLINLHDYAFSLLSPRVVFLVDGMDQRVIFLVLFYKLAHPKKIKRKKVERLVTLRHVEGPLIDVEPLSYVLSPTTIFYF